jgi:hypothetical protein
LNTANALDARNPSGAKNLLGPSTSFESLNLLDWINLGVAPKEALLLTSNMVQIHHMHEIHAPYKILESRNFSVLSKELAPSNILESSNPFVAHKAPALSFSGCIDLAGAMNFCVNKETGPAVHSLLLLSGFVTQPQL